MRRYVLASEGRDLVLRESIAGTTPQEPAQESVSSMLTSGFNRQSLSALSCPLSPTLQLNADLAACSPGQLLHIAQAEHDSRLASQPKSYLYTVKSRAAVIAANPEDLAAFLDLYGGILETVPICLATRPHPDYITADELKLDNGQNNTCKIRIWSRTPIDQKLCTWCRKCITSCREECIAPGPEIDFDRCTFCGDCVSACPTGAIELYARSEIEVVVPAVILLGDPGIELPADQQMIFSDRKLENFLRQIGEHQVEETVGYHRELCQYSGRLEAGCCQCIEACPHNTIRADERGIIIDHLICRDCGACIAACPTGALQDERFRDRNFISYFAHLQLPGRTTAVLGSETELFKLWWLNGEANWGHTFFLEYPQIGALTTMHLLFLFSLGFRQVVLLANGNPATMVAGREQKLAAEIIERLFAVSDFVVTTNAEKFTTVVSPKKASPLSVPGNDFSYSSRRRKLAFLLRFLFTAGAATTSSEPWSADTCGPTFGRLVCDAQRCTSCVACLNECYTGALTTDQRSYTLKHEPVLCVQCGLCVSVCPEKALTLEPGLILAPSFMQSEILSQSEPMICPGCGTRFGTRKSFERVIGLLRQTGRFADQEEVLSYCENCRAARMFASHAK